MRTSTHRSQSMVTLYSSTHASLTVNGHVTRTHTRTRIAHSQWTRYAYAHTRTRTHTYARTQAHKHASLTVNGHVTRTNTRARTHMQGHKHTRTHRSQSMVT